MTRIEFSKKITGLIQRMFAEGDNPCPHEWFRDARLQAIYYQQGRGNPGAIITNCDGINKKSAHQSGKAIDVYLTDDDGEIVWDVLKEGCEKYKEKILYYHSIWDKEYGGKPMIDKPGLRDFPHFEG